MRTELDRIAENEYARKQGVKQGLEQGVKRGLERGREEGREEAFREMARAQLKKGMSPAEIAELTGITSEIIGKGHSRRAGQNR